MKLTSPMPIRLSLVLLAFVLLTVGWMRSTERTKAQGSTVPPFPLTLTKSDQNMTALPGDTIVYQLDYRNDSLEPVAEVTLHETVPAHTTFNAGASSNGWNCTVTTPGGICTLDLGELAAAATGIVGFAVTVDNRVPDGVTEIANTAEIKSEAGSQLASDTTPLTAAPDLYITKSDGRNSTTPGSLLTYAIRFGNRGTQDATGVVLTEIVPAGTRFRSAESSVGWACSPASGAAGATCTLTIGGVAAGAPEEQRTFVVGVNNPANAGLSRIQNSVSIADDGNNGPDSDPLNNTATDATTLNAAPDLVVTKIGSPHPVQPGGVILYDLTGSNVGNQGATGVMLLEDLPANTQYEAASSTAGWVFDSSRGRWKFVRGGLTVGSTFIVKFAVRVVNPAPAGVDAIVNTVTIADDGRNGADPTPDNNTASAAVTLNAAPDLTLTKSDGGFTAEPGDTVVYALRYTNSGTQEATGVNVVETVPPNTTFAPASSTPGWGCLPDNRAGSICTLTIGTLRADGQGTLNFGVTLNTRLDSTVTQISNRATISDDGSNGPDSTPDNNSATDITPIQAPTLLSISKDDGGFSVLPGDDIEYVLTYANNSAVPATGVRITETVPAHTIFVGLAGEWSCPVGSTAGTICTHTVGTMVAGASGTLSFIVRVNGAVPAEVSAIINQAIIGNGALPNADTGDDLTPLAAPADLRIHKSDGGNLAVPGASLVYRLTYSNTGGLEATGVVITETVPAHTTFNAAASTPGWGCQNSGAAGDICTYAVGNLLANGTNATVDFAIVVVDPLPNSVTQIDNTALIGDDGKHGVDPTPQNRASVTTPVAAAALLTLRKSAGDITAEPGETILYALSYANVGNQVATGVTISETVPAHTVFQGPAVDWSCAPGSPAGTTCLYTVGTLAAQGTGSVIFTVAVNETAPTGVTQLVNRASITSRASVAPVLATDITPLNAAPNLSLTKSDGGQIAAAGDTVVYGLTYQNKGNQDATGVVITEQLPPNSTFNPAQSTAGWNCNGALCTLPIGGLAAGVSGAVNFAVTVNQPLPESVTQITNNAAITDDSSNGPDSDPGDNAASDSTPIASPRLTATKQVALVVDVDQNGQINPGDVLEYTIVIKNESQVAVNNITFNDPVPVNTQLAAANAVQTTQGTVNTGNNANDATVAITLGALTANASATIKFRVQVKNPLPAGVTFVENQGVVTYNNGQRVLTDDPGVVGVNNPTRTAVSSRAQVRVTKRDQPLDDDGDGLLEPGERIRYQLEIVNNGNVAVTNLVLADPLSTALSVRGNTLQTNRGVIISGSQAGQNPVRVELNELKVGANQQVVISFEVVIARALTVNQVSNQATVTYLSSGETISLLSDDPDTPAADDATLTAVTLPAPGSTETRTYFPFIRR